MDLQDTLDVLIQMLESLECEVNIEIPAVDRVYFRYILEPQDLWKLMISYRNSITSYRDSMVWDPQAYGNQWIPIGFQWSGTRRPMEIIEFL